MQSNDATEDHNRPTGKPAESFSQWGEDRLVHQFFGERRQGTFFESGAFHPTSLSQTYFLEKQGWTGVLVEPVADLAHEFARLRPNSRLFQCALGAPEESGQTLTFVITHNSSVAHLLEPDEKPDQESRILQVPMTTISNVLAEAGLNHIDYLSLDLEGHELAALRGLDFSRIRPALILIEDHLHDLTRHFFLKRQGYKLVFRTGSNNWYIPAEATCAFCTPGVRLELIRKLYLSMPFRKLQIWLKRRRGLPV